MEFTALSIKDGLSCGSSTPPQEVFVCGGGAQNNALMHLLADKMPKSVIADTTPLGLAPDWVEAVAFAWLAKQTMSHLPGNLPSVTGAGSETILGGVYYA